MTVRQTAPSAGIAGLVAIASLLGAPSGSSATSCTDQASLLAKGAVYRDTEASGRGLSLARTMRARLDKCSFKESKRVAASVIDGVNRRVALVAKTAPKRSRIFSADGFLPQLPTHPLHDTIYRKRQVPRPDGCKQRTYRVIARVQTTPDFESLLALEVVRSEAGFKGVDEEEAVGAILSTTKVRGLRRHGVPYIGRGAWLVLGMSNCELNQSAIRTVREQPR